MAVPVPTVNTTTQVPFPSLLLAPDPDSRLLILGLGNPISKHGRILCLMNNYMAEGAFLSPQLKDGGDKGTLA